MRDAGKTGLGYVYHVIYTYGIVSDLKTHGKLVCLRMRGIKSIIVYNRVKKVMHIFA